jgi:pyruvate ferredoxin oxidoreductase alpha subunit
MHRASENAIEVHAEAVQDFERIFGRRYNSLDAYRLEDADKVIVMAGCFATKGKEAVNRWRKQGQRVGLLRQRMIRPQPAGDLVRALSGRAAVGVIDQNLSPGLGGILYHEIAAALATSAARPTVLRSFVGGLGGKDISQAELDHVLRVLDTSEPTDHPAESELLFTQDDWQQVQQRLALAGKPVEVES